MNSTSLASPTTSATVFESATGFLLNSILIFDTATDGAEVVYAVLRSYILVLDGETETVVGGWEDDGFMGLRVMDMVFASVEEAFVWVEVDLGVGFAGWGGGSLGSMNWVC